MDVGSRRPQSSYGRRKKRHLRSTNTDQLGTFGLTSAVERQRADRSQSQRYRDRRAPNNSNCRPRITVAPVKKNVESICAEEGDSETENEDNVSTTKKPQTEELIEIGDDSDDNDTAVAKEPQTKESEASTGDFKIPRKTRNTPSTIVEGILNGESYNGESFLDHRPTTRKSKAMALTKAPNPDIKIRRRCECSYGFCVTRFADCSSRYLIILTQYFAADNTSVKQKRRKTTQVVPGRIFDLQSRMRENRPQPIVGRDQDREDGRGEMGRAIVNTKNEKKSRSSIEDFSDNTVSLFQNIGNKAASVVRGLSGAVRQRSSAGSSASLASTTTSRYFTESDSKSTPSTNFSSRVTTRVTTRSAGKRKPSGFSTPQSSRKSQRGKDDPETIELLDDSEEEDTPQRIKRLSTPVIRIMVGKKTLVNDCRIEWSNVMGPKLTLRGKMKTREKSFALKMTEDSLHQVCYFDGKNQSGPQCFLGLKVEPDEESGLTEFGVTADDWILILFQSFPDLDHVKNGLCTSLLSIKQMMQTGKLESVDEADPICQEFLNATRNSQNGKKFLRGRQGDDILLEYPFQGHALEAAARGLPECSYGDEDDEVRGKTTKVQPIEASSKDDPGDEGTQTQRSHAAVIRVNEYNRLLEWNEFLNDSLIDFWMMW